MSYETNRIQRKAISDSIKFETPGSIKYNELVKQMSHLDNVMSQERLPDSFTR